MPDVRMLVDLRALSSIAHAATSRPGASGSFRAEAAEAPVERSDRAVARRSNVFWRRALLVFGAFIVFVILSADLGLPLPILNWVVYLPGRDFTGHAILIGTLAFFAGGAFPRLLRGVISVGALVVGVLILGEEISQLWIAHRSFSASDLLGNALGITVAEFLRRGGGYLVCRVTGRGIS